MNNVFEPLQNGNPYGLTREQHFIPASHIKRFYNSNNKVFCKNFLSKNKTQIEINAYDSIFKVQRLWAEFAEKGFMKNIEDNFNKLVDNVTKGNIKEFNQEQSSIICDMYTLWERRCYHIDEFNKTPILNIKLYGIDGEYYTKDEKEKIERMHMTFLNENTEVSSRDIIGNQIMLYIYNSLYNKIEWGILKSTSKLFIMPSNPCMNNSYTNMKIFFPISPNYCLVPQKIYCNVNESDVKKLNNIMIQNAKWFYFGKRINN